jgi:hypothetical protein
MEILDVNEKCETVYVDLEKHFTYQYKSEKLYSKYLKKYLKDRGFEEEPLPTASQLFDEMVEYKKIMDTVDIVNKQFYKILIDQLKERVEEREYVDPNDKKMVEYSNQYKKAVDEFENSKEYKKFLEKSNKIYDDLKVERPVEED